MPSKKRQIKKAQKLTFKVSASLKDIIGKELITDEFVAIFELVKNSFDAGAKSVNVIFENLRNPAKAKIIIKDNGKGMSFDDLKDKWLFVAYSAKKLGVEDKDYRSRIKNSRVYAGAKGIGRFSCDRLGSDLTLLTKLKTKNSKVESLVVDWEDFENVEDEEFVNIGVSHNTLSENSYKLISGTVLEITNLRDNWDRAKFKKLKQSLAKLVNPNQNNDSDNFKIFLDVKSEVKEDKAEQFQFLKVNGVIKNSIFEELEIKSTNILVEVSKNGEYIETTLQDRGDIIFNLKEKNNFPLLKNISIYLFQLNRNAKTIFSRKMGMQPKAFGSIFMYKNGFRIYPFGEPGVDLLGIDERKAQGYNRFLGTRDLIGRIEIYGENKNLYETSSRDGGLVRTKTYNELLNLFMSVAMRRLEKYVVNVIRWGDAELDKMTKQEKNPALWPKDVKEAILVQITDYMQSDSLVDIQYDKDFLKIIDSKKDKSVARIVKNISKLAVKSGDKKILSEAKKIQKAVTNVRKDNKKLVKEIAKEKRQNLFQKSLLNTDKEDLVSLQHHIHHSASEIDFNLSNLVRSIVENGKKEQQLKFLNEISLEVKKISSLSSIVTKANFNTMAVKITENIIKFINDYVTEVFVNNTHHLHEKRKIKIKISNLKTFDKRMKFIPLEAMLLIDNLFINAKKAGASEISMKWALEKKFLLLSISNNGIAVEKEDIDKIFEFGFSTTENGSGIGLHHCKDIVKRMKGNLTVNPNKRKGAEFFVRFPL